MTVPGRSWSGRSLSGRQVRILLLVIFLLACLAGLAMAQQPLAALGLALALILLPAALAWPNVATLVVIFILYTNAAVVAVRYHGVPMAVGTVFPLLLALPLGYYLLVRREKLVITPVLPLIVLLLIIQLLSALFSAEPSVSVPVLTASAIEGLAIYFLVTNVVRTPQVLMRVIWVLLAAGALMGGLSVYQQVTKTYSRNYGGFAQMSNAAFKTGEEESYTEARQGRLAGPIGEQNRYAQIMLMLVPLGLFQFFGGRSVALRTAGGGGHGTDQPGACAGLFAGRRRRVPDDDPRNGLPALHHMAAVRLGDGGNSPADGRAARL